MEFLFLLIVLCILWLYCRDLLPGAKRRWNSRISSSSTFCSVGPSSVGLSHSRGLSVDAITGEAARLPHPAVHHLSAFIFPRDSGLAFPARSATESRLSSPPPFRRLEHACVEDLLVALWFARAKGAPEDLAEDRREVDESDEERHAMDHRAQNMGNAGAGRCPWAPFGLWSGVENGRLTWRAARSSSLASRQFMLKSPRGACSSTG